MVANRRLFQFLVLLSVGLNLSLAHAVPTSVTLTGNLQDELGCPGDFDPACSLTHLNYVFDDDVWQATFDLPVGAWEYIAAIDDSFAERYGANATPGGANIALDLAVATTVRFYYDDKSHWITDNVNSVIATLVGDFQSELGCSGDFDPGCLRSWLQDPDGDGIYRFLTTGIPVGSYSVLVVHNEDFGEIAVAQTGFVVPASDTLMCFTYDPGRMSLAIVSGSCDVRSVPAPAPIALLALGMFCMGRQRSTALPWRRHTGSAR